MKNLLAFLAALALALILVPPTLSAAPEPLPSSRPAAVLSAAAPAPTAPEAPSPEPSASASHAAPVLLAADMLPGVLEPEDTPAPTPEPAPEPTPEPATVRLLTGGKVVTLPLEEYVTGTTAAEMPPWFPAEALKAQAIAVRTLALRDLLAAQAGRGKHRNADLCADPACCMAYRPPAEADEAVQRAVRDTAGIIAVYRDEPILAVFCAAVRGRTKSSAQVWGGALDYLVPAESPETVSPGGHGVGMSQYGAAALAEQGFDAEAILKHYYTGVTLADCSAFLPPSDPSH